MPIYNCFAPGHAFEPEDITTETSFEARQAYGAKHGLHPLDVVSRRSDCVDAKWRKAAARNAMPD
jgi:hypothetical protein